MFYGVGPRTTARGARALCANYGHFPVCCPVCMLRFLQSGQSIVLDCSLNKRFAMGPRSAGVCPVLKPDASSLLLFSQHSSGVHIWRYKQCTQILTALYRVAALLIPLCECNYPVMTSDFDRFVSSGRLIRAALYTPHCCCIHMTINLVRAHTTASQHSYERIPLELKIT